MLGLITISIFAGYMFAAYFIVKLQKNRRKKIIAAIIMILIPTWDVIIGRAVFYTLCATQGGVHVYQTVELGPEYFDKEGVPLFYDRSKIFNNMTLAERYVGVSEHKKNISRLLNVKLIEKKILDKNRNIELGSITYFIHFGGWAFNSLNTGAASGNRCPESSGDHIVELSKKVFILDAKNN